MGHKSRQLIWFAASAIHYFEPARRTRAQGYLASESVYLIRAGNPRAAMREAERIGVAEAAVDDNAMTLNGVPVRLTFGGIRKLLAIGPGSIELGPYPVRRMRSGVEATYSMFLVNDRRALRRLVGGKCVATEYQEEPRIARWSKAGRP